LILFLPLSSCTQTHFYEQKGKQKINNKTVELKLENLQTNCYPNTMADRKVNNKYSFMHKQVSTGSNV